MHPSPNASPSSTANVLDDERPHFHPNKRASFPSQQTASGRTYICAKSKTSSKNDSSIRESRRVLSDGRKRMSHSLSELPSLGLGDCSSGMSPGISLSLFRCKFFKRGVQALKMSDESYFFPFLQLYTVTIMILSKCIPLLHSQRPGRRAAWRVGPLRPLAVQDVRAPSKRLSWTTGGSSLP